MTDDPNRAGEQLAEASVARVRAEYEAAHRPPARTPEQELDARLRAARFRDVMSEHALLHGAHPRALRHILRDAEAMFEMRDGAVVPRDGRTTRATRWRR